MILILLKWNQLTSFYKIKFVQGVHGAGYTYRSTNFLAGLSHFVLCKFYVSETNLMIA